MFNIFREINLTWNILHATNNTYICRALRIRTN